MTCCVYTCLWHNDWAWHPHAHMLFPHTPHLALSILPFPATFPIPSAWPTQPRSSVCVRLPGCRPAGVLLFFLTPSPCSLSLLPLPCLPFLGSPLCRPTRLCSSIRVCLPSGRPAGVRSSSNSTNAAGCQPSPGLHGERTRGDGTSGEAVCQLGQVSGQRTAVAVAGSSVIYSISRHSSNLSSKPQKRVQMIAAVVPGSSTKKGQNEGRG